jgi:hypothetical protein
MGGEWEVLSASVESGDAERVAAQLTEHSEEFSSESLGRLLGTAILRGHLHVARLLIEAGADVNAYRESAGCEHPEADAADHAAEAPYLPPLFTAVNQENRDAVRLLLEAGADINLRLPQSGLTALDCAGASGDLPMLEYLDQHGARIGPLTLARAMEGTGDAHGRRAAAVQWLLDRGASPAWWDRTLLGNAIYHADPDTVLLLLDRGEDVLWVNAAGQTALQYASDLRAREEQASVNDVQLLARRSEVVRILQAHDSNRFPVRRRLGAHALTAFLQRFPVILGLPVVLVVGWLVFEFSRPQDDVADSTDPPPASVGDAGQLPASAAKESVDLVEFLGSRASRGGLHVADRLVSSPNVAQGLLALRDSTHPRFADACARMAPELPQGMCPFIEVRQCVGSGCFVDGIRRAGAPFDLFSAPGAPVREWTAARGQPFLAETTWLFTVPCRAIVDYVDPNYGGLRVGEKAYALSYVGEGTYRYATPRGIRAATVTDEVRHVDCADHWDRSEIWIRLRAEDGTTGWTPATDALQGTSNHEPPIPDADWPIALGASRIPSMPRGALCAYPDRPLDGAEMGILFEDSLLRGQTADGAPWTLVIGSLRGDEGNTFLLDGENLRKNGNYRLESNRICFNQIATRDWHCVAVARCWGQMGGEGFVIANSAQEQMGLILEYEMAFSQGVWAD